MLQVVLGYGTSCEACIMDAVRIYNDVAGKKTFLCQETHRGCDEHLYRTEIWFLLDTPGPDKEKKEKDA